MNNITINDVVIMTWMGKSSLHINCNVVAGWTCLMEGWKNHAGPMGGGVGERNL